MRTFVVISLLALCCVFLAVLAWGLVISPAIERAAEKNAIEMRQKALAKQVLDDIAEQEQLAAKAEMEAKIAAEEGRVKSLKVFEQAHKDFVDKKPDWAQVRPIEFFYGYKDGWGKSIQFEQVNDKTFTLRSGGPDGVTFVGDDDLIQEFDMPKPRSEDK